MTKEIVINGIRYCQYEIDKDILFIKILICFKGYTKGQMEINLMYIISSIEGLPFFNRIAYLNI